MLHSSKNWRMSWTNQPLEGGNQCRSGNFTEIHRLIIMTLPSYNSEPTSFHPWVFPLRDMLPRGRISLAYLEHVFSPVVRRAGEGGCLSSDAPFYQNGMFGGKFSQRDTGYKAAVDVHDIVSPGCPFAHIPIHRSLLIPSFNSTESYHILKCTPSWKSQPAAAPRSKVRGLLFPKYWISSCTSYLRHQSAHAGPDFQLPALVTFCLWVFFGHWRSLWPFLGQARSTRKLSFLGEQPSTKD